MMPNERIELLEKKVAELEQAVRLINFIPEDSDGIRDSHVSISTVPRSTNPE